MQGLLKPLVSAARGEAGMPVMATAMLAILEATQAPAVTQRDSSTVLGPFKY